MDSSPRLSTFIASSSDQINAQTPRAIGVGQPFDPSLDYVGVASLFGSFDSPLRLQILGLLAERDHFVFEPVDALKCSQPLISQHLRVLKKSGLITSERRGRQIIYRLLQPEAMLIVEQTLRLFEKIAIDKQSA